jgi:hypothetical protein
MQEQMPEQGQGEGGQGEALKQMIVQTAQSIDNIAQVLGQASPEAGQALAQVGEQFRAVIEGMMQGGGQQQQQAPSRMQDAHAQGAKVSQAY